MKKTLGIILLVALTLVTFGCKKIDDLGNTKDVPKWNSMESLGGNSEKLLDIRAEKHAINWWVITDMNGVVFDDYEIISGEGNQFNNEDDYVEIGKTETIPQGKAIRLKFDVEKNTDLILWIAQDDRIPAKKDSNGNEFPAGAKDYRGKIKISTSQGYSIKDQGYREEVSPVGVIDITCNETAGKQGCAWNGNYRVTEVWPLSQKENSPEWEATEGLKFILDAENYIEEGFSKKFIFPADQDTVLALKQPDRFDAEKDDVSKMEKQKDWYWCLPFCSEDKIEITDDKEGLYQDIKFYEVKAHTVVPVASGDCKFYFKLGSFYKSAMGAEYVVDEFYTSSEK